MMEIRRFSKRQKEKDKIISWAEPSMVHHFVLENRNEDSGKILAKLIDKQAKLQQRAEPVVISCGYMCFRHTR